MVKQRHGYIAMASSPLIATPILKKATIIIWPVLTVCISIGQLVPYSMYVEQSEFTFTLPMHVFLLAFITVLTQVNGGTIQGLVLLH